MPLHLRLHYFVLSAGVASPEKTVAIIGWQRPAKDGYFDGAGFPVGPDWDEIPGADDGHAERLVISGVATTCWSGARQS